MGIDQSLLMYSMLSGNGSGTDMLLPLMMLQRNKGSLQEATATPESTAVDEDFVNMLVYKPLGERILTQFAQKIQGMTSAQVAKLLAAVSLESMGRSQQGKFGDMLVLASHTSLMDLLGEPGAVVGDQSLGRSLRSQAKVGGQILGKARKEVEEKVEGLDVTSLASKASEASRARTAGRKKTPKKYTPVF